MAAHKPVTPEEFSHSLEAFAAPLKGVKKIGIAVSGGPDSMALGKLLSLWAKKHKVEMHALTVDHGLRPEAAKEAKLVAARLKGWPNTSHKILNWKGVKPKARIMEAAREARYKLMADYCLKNGIRHLFLAHHQDDQAETFLFRLAKGSGLDGLSSIRPVQKYNDDLWLMRPLLSISKQQLEATCKSQKLPFMKDPSNAAEKYARPRLRKSWKILEEEGLSSKRLATTAMRLERARRALEEMAEKSFKKNVITKDTKRIVLDSAMLKDSEDVGLRVVIRAIEILRPDLTYRPRMEKIEDLFGDLRRPAAFRKRTLGGLVFERNDRKHLITVSVEKP